MKNRCKDCEYEHQFVCPGDIYQCIREPKEPKKRKKVRVKVSEGED